MSASDLQTRVPRASRSGGSATWRAHTASDPAGPRDAPPPHTPLASGLGTSYLTSSPPFARGSASASSRDACVRVYCRDPRAPSGVVLDVAEPQSVCREQQCGIELLERSQEVHVLQQRDEPAVSRVGPSRHEMAAPGTAAQVRRGVGPSEEEPRVLDAHRVALGHAPGEEGQVVRDWVSDAEATENRAAATSLLQRVLQLAQLHEAG
eukprot:scaffold113891_cov69-Phaeocystis_antarctica.AAC.6